MPCAQDSPCFLMFFSKAHHSWMRCACIERNLLHLCPYVSVQTFKVLNDEPPMYKPDLNVMALTLQRQSAAASQARQNSSLHKNMHTRKLKLETLPWPKVMLDQNLVTWIPLRLQMRHPDTQPSSLYSRTPPPTLQTPNLLQRAGGGCTVCG